MIKHLLLVLFCVLCVSLMGQSRSTSRSNLFSASQEKEVQIFPNPTSDIFYLKNDESVATIMIYNIVGKEVKSFEHSVGNGYEVNDLRKGIYVVRLFDPEDKIIKVLRLNKK